MERFVTWQPPPGAAVALGSQHPPGMRTCVPLCPAPPHMVTPAAQPLQALEFVMPTLDFAFSLSHLTQEVAWVIPTSMYPQTVPLSFFFLLLNKSLECTQFQEELCSGSGAERGGLPRMIGCPLAPWAATSWAQGKLL